MEWYPVVSCDSHVHEPRDLYQRYLPDHLRDRGPRVVSLEVGDKIMMGEKKVRWVGPEVQEEFDRSDRSWVGGARYEYGRRGKFEPDARKADLACDGVQAEVVYGFLYWMDQPDREVLWHMIRIYNDWIADFFSDVKDRSIGVPMLPSWDVQAAVDELQRVVRTHGARAAQIPVPYVGEIQYGYSNPDYDPLWAALSEAGVPLAVHIATGAANKRFSGPGSELHDMMNAFGDAQEVVREFIGAGIFERFPDLRLAATEGGIGWAPWYLNTMDEMWRDYGATFQPALKDPPSAYFARNCLLTFQNDPPGVNNIDQIAGSVAWGSDYPHSEGTYPQSRAVIAEQLGHLPAEQQRTLCGGNAAKFFGFDLELIAKKYGPGSDHHAKYSQADGGAITPEMLEPVLPRS